MTRAAFLVSAIAGLTLFNIVPGLPALMLQPWLIGYLVLVIPLSMLLKRVFGIY